MTNNKPTTYKDSQHRVSGTQVMVSGTLIMFLLGAAYIWSIYIAPLTEAFNWTQTQASMPFSVFLLAYTAGMIFGGRLQDRYGPRRICLIGSLLFGGGYFLSGFANGLFYLSLVYGVVGGVGAGFAYVTPVATVVKWFPEKKGLMGGIVIFGFGAGAFLFAPVASRLIEAFSWRTAFFSLGAVFMVVAFMASWFMVLPPEKDKENEQEAKEDSVADIPPSVALKMPLFWIVWTAWFLALGVGLGNMGHIVSYAAGTGITPLKAAFVLSVAAVFNGIGRIAMGALSDRFSRLRLLAGSCFAMGAVSVMLIISAGNIGLFYFTGILFGLSFGALLILYPVITAELFGTKYLGTNYGLLFSSYGLGGFFGPIIFGKAYDYSSSYSFIFILAAVACIGAGFLVLSLRRMGHVNLKG